MIGTMEIAFFEIIILIGIIVIVLWTSKKSKEEQKQVVKGADLDELLKYKKLLDDGVITEDEYNAKKAQLM